MLDGFELQGLELLLHLFEDELGIDRCSISGDMDIDAKEEKNQDSREEFYDILFFFSGEDADETLCHDDRRIMADHCKNILHPLVDTFPDGWVDGLVIEFHRAGKSG